MVSPVARMSPREPCLHDRFIVERALLDTMSHCHRVSLLQAYVHYGALAINQHS